MSDIRKNTASQIVKAHLVAVADGEDVTTGTTTVYVTAATGSQAAGSGTVTHEGNGVWSYQPTQAETNYDAVSYTWVNTAAVTVTKDYRPITLDDYKATGFSTLDAAGVRTAVGLAAADLDTQLGDIDSKTTNLPSDPADQSLIIAATDAIASDIEALNDVSVADILAGTGDTGVSLAKMIEMVAALAAGKVTASSAAGVTTLTYKKRDGSTTSFTTVVTEADKTRATTGALS